jgi:microcystin degradation protein MlrC
MSKPRIAVAGFQHETNTFAPILTPFETFRDGGAWPALCTGQAVIDTLSGLNLPMGGFIDESDDFDLVPIVWTFAEPGGYVTDDAFDRIAGMIIDGVTAAGSIDGIYLDLHGAMVTQSHEDGEAELLRRLRAVVGEDLPIAVSLDLHGNLSRAFFERASCVAIYRTYPHVDMADTGARARKLLREQLGRGAPFAKAWRQLDYIIPIQAQSTRRQPGGRLYAMLPGLAGNGVSSVDFVFGFPPADVADCGCSVFAYGSEQAAVDAAADKMFSALQAAETELNNPLVPAPEAVAQARKIAASASKPVIICDPQDNPGAGATGDTTGVLAALVEGGAQGAIIGMLWDAETAAQAHAAGVGAEIDAHIGGKFPELGTGPFRRARPGGAVVGRRLHVHRPHVRQGACAPRPHGGAQGAGPRLRRDSGGRLQPHPERRPGDLHPPWPQPGRSQDRRGQVGGAFPRRLRAHRRDGDLCRKPRCQPVPAGCHTVHKAQDRGSAGPDGACLQALTPCPTSMCGIELQ